MTASKTLCSNDELVRKAAQLKLDIRDCKVGWREIIERAVDIGYSEGFNAATDRRKYLEQQKEDKQRRQREKDDMERKRKERVERRRNQERNNGVRAEADLLRTFRWLNYLRF